MALAAAPLIGAAVGGVAAVLYGLTGALAVVLFWAAVPLFIGEPFATGATWRIVILLSLLFEWQFFQIAVAARDPLLVCIATQAVPRAAVIGLAWISRPAATPPRYTQSLNSAGALLVIAQGIVAAFLTGWFSGALILAACYLATRLLRVWAYKNTGGVDQKTLAYAHRVLEICVLLALSVPLPTAFPTFAIR